MKTFKYTHLRMLKSKSEWHVNFDLEYSKDIYSKSFTLDNPTMFGKILQLMFARINPQMVLGFAYMDNSNTRYSDQVLKTVGNGFLGYEGAHSALSSISAERV